MERRALSLCSLALGALLATPATTLAAPGSGPPEASAKAVSSLPLRVSGEDGNRRLMLGKRVLLESSELPTGPVTYDEVTLEAGERALVVHVGEGDARFAALLVGGGPAPRVVWSGSERLMGDPGERRGMATAIVRDDTEAAHVLVGETYERARLCGDTAKPLLLRRELTARSLTPYSVARPGGGAAAPASVAVLPQGPASPALTLLSPRAISEQNGQIALDPPYSATDRLRTTSTRLEHAGDFVTLGYGGGDFGLAHLDVAIAGTAPQRFRVHFDTAHIDVDVPEDTPPDSVIRITPETTLQTGCLSLQRLDTSPQPLEIAEIAAFSTLEQDGSGVNSLIAALQGPQALEATRVLKQAGPSLVPALVAAWPALDAEARKRTVGLIARHPQQAGAPAVLLDALRNDDEELSATAAATLLDTRATTGRELVARAIAMSPSSPSLAERAARSGDPDLLPAILAGLSGATDGTQSGLIRALETLLGRVPEGAPLGAALEAFEATAPPPLLQSRVALALGKAGRAAASAARMADTSRTTLASQPAPAFEDTWWLVQALSTLPAEEAGDAFLQGRVDASPHWMVREAALLALQSRESPALQANARAALKDDYPRVRATAVRVLADAPNALPELLPHLTRDRWHLVRSVAAEVLPDTPAVREALIRAVGDRIDPVQVAAIERAAALSMTEAAAPILDRLADDRESGAVRSAAARFAGQTCQVQASPTLADLVDAGIAPGAKEPAQELAIRSLETLAQLGATDEVRPRLQVIADPGLRAAAEQALKAPSHCRRVGTQLRL